MPHSGSDSTYPAVQFSGATSIVCVRVEANISAPSIGHRQSLVIHMEDDNARKVGSSSGSGS